MSIWPPLAPYNIFKSHQPLVIIEEVFYFQPPDYKEMVKTSTGLTI